MKRLFDIIVSGSALIVLSPVMLLLAIWIKLDSRGPIFYRGSRVGLGGRDFRIFKFRTMVVDAEKLGGSSTADGDPRITRVGKFLRKFKLDELPQLFDVLRGEMSLVGPRPEVRHYTDMYTEREKKILGVRPGITDWASLWNSDEGAVLAGSSDPERDYLEKIRPGKIKLQLAYVEKRSLWVDTKILWETAMSVVLRREPKAHEVFESDSVARDGAEKQAEEQEEKACPTP